jgi:MFS transporter, DHA3 family, macrolide efflux protein
VVQIVLTERSIRFRTTNGSLEGATRQIMKLFALVWLGQLVSKIGSGLSVFVLGVWLYQLTGSVTRFAVMYMCMSVPVVLLSPIAGALVDRFYRRTALIFTEGVGALSMSVVALLVYNGLLNIWLVYCVALLIAVCNTIKWQALSTATSLIVNESDFGRTSGMLQLAEGIVSILSPLLGGMLLGILAPSLVILVTVPTFLFAILVLLIVSMPEPRSISTNSLVKKNLWREMAFGWAYITARPGLLSLLIYFATTNFLTGMFALLLTPLVLSLASAQTLGVVQAIAGVGMVAGSLLMTAWRGPRIRVDVILIFMLLSGVSILVAGAKPSITCVTLANFVVVFSLPFVVSSSQAIWQTKVPPNLQGKVFGIRRMITQASYPLSYLLVGPITENIAKVTVLFENIRTLPAIRGMTFVMFVIGIVLIVVTICGFFYPPLRRLETST